MTVRARATRPLLVTRDEALLDELLRLTAAAGTTPEVAPDGGAALAAWPSAPVVLVGADVVGELARLTPARRPGVHLVACGLVPEEALRQGLAVGVEGVAELPGGADAVVDTLTDVGDGPEGVGTVLGVVPGSGGAGATTFACAVAQVAAANGSSLLVDADPLGAGAETVLGLADEAGARWDSLGRTTGRLGARALREGLPRRATLGVLAWPTGPACPSVSPTAARETLAAARRGHRTVVVDLPRPTDPMTSELAGRCDQLWVVVVPSARGVLAAARVVERLPQAPRVSLVLRGPLVDEAEIARRVGAPVAVAMADQRRLDETIGLGRGPLRSRRGPLARAAREALVRVTAGEVAA